MQILHWLNCRGRLLDTAAFYGNEDTVGRAVQKAMDDKIAAGWQAATYLSFESILPFGVLSHASWIRVVLYERHYASRTKKLHIKCCQTFFQALMLCNRVRCHSCLRRDLVDSSFLSSGFWQKGHNSESLRMWDVETCWNFLSLVGTCHCKQWAWVVLVSGAQNSVVSCSA
jgi:hypothetical protein